MRNQFLSLSICFLLVSACFGQVSLNKQSEHIIIAGKFNGFNADTASRFLNFYFDNVFENDVNEICQIDDDGAFIHKTKRPFARDYFFIYEDIQLSFFVSGGDSIYIEIDLKKQAEEAPTSDFVSFSGSNENFNNSLDDFYDFYNSRLSNYELDDSMRTNLKPLAYKAYIQKRDSIFKAEVSTYNRENKSSKAFELWANNNVKYDSYSRLLGYRFWFPFKNKLNRDSFLLQIPEDYFSFLSTKNFNNTKALENSIFHIFLTEYSQYLREILPEDSSKQAREYYKNKNYTAYFSIDQRNIIRNTSGLSQDLLLAAFYYQLLENGKLTVYDTLKKKYPIQKPLLNSWLKEKYTELNLVLNLEERRDNIELNDGVNIMEENILDSILRKHKGKLLYLDFWAPWCSPCMNEMQFSENLHSTINNDEVSLIYLANQCSKDSWKVAIAKNNPIGDHYLLTDEQYNLLSKQFNISGLPRYILIGKNGEVIEADPPWPSEIKKLTQLINTSLDLE